MGFEYFPPPISGAGKEKKNTKEEPEKPIETVFEDIPEKESAERKETTPRVTKGFIEDRRVLLEGDEWLSKKQKKAFGGLIDELEEVSDGLKKKSYSPEETKEKRIRKSHLVRRLQTGREAGVTKEDVEAAREKGERGILESATRGQLDEALQKNEELVPVESVFSPEDIQALKEKLGFGEKPAQVPEQEPEAGEGVIGWVGGMSVKVRRSSGDIEQWKVLSHGPRKPDESVLVWNGVEGDGGIIKWVPSGELWELQSSEYQVSEKVGEKVSEKAEEDEQPEIVGPQKNAEEILDAIPNKEKPSWVRKIVGAGFGIQQAKNWAGEQAFGFAYKKFFESAVEAKKQSKELTGIEKARFETGLLMRSVARHYAEAKETSEKNKEDFYAGKSKGKEWLKLGGEGIRAIRAVFGPMGMLRSPVWVLMGLTRISETAKEMRFEKKKYDVTSDEAAEEAMAMYEEAEKEAEAAGREVPNAEDISRVYAKGVVRGTLEAGTGALTKTVAGLGVKKLIEPLFKEMQAVEGDASLSVEEKQTRLSELARKNEKLIKEVDLLVNRAGSVDAVAYGLRQAGVWSKRIAGAVAIESILEMGYHGLLGAFSEGADAHAQGAEVSSLKRPFVASTATILEHSGETEGLDLEGVEAPPQPVVIAEGGNIWSSAKEIAEREGLSKEQFAHAWEDSTVTLPDGRNIPIAELNLVHEGDELSYVPGENGEAGHFEFNNESHIAYGDALNLPGAHEPEVISKMDFEQQPFGETIDVTAPEGDAYEEEMLAKLKNDPIYAGIDDEHLRNIIRILSDNSVGAENITDNNVEAVTETATSPIDKLAELGIEKYSADVVDKELRWYFGQKYQNSDMWKGIKDMSVRRFEKMSLDTGDKEGMVLQFREYMENIGKKAGIPPQGGFFKRDETVLEYFSRVRRALIEQKAAGR